MVFETVKLADLADDEVVSFEDETYTLTVSVTLTVAELKEKLKKDNDATRKKWYVVQSQTWNPDAKRMIENYIKNEYKEMPDDWDDRANDCITEEVVQKIQSILDKAFESETVKQYWILKKKIEI